MTSRRGVVLAPDDGSDVLLLINVVRHDDAYTWAAKRLYTVNTATRVLEVRNVVAVEELAPALEKAAAAAPTLLFAEHPDTVLKGLGIDDQVLRAVRPVIDKPQLFTRHHDTLGAGPRTLAKRPPRLRRVPLVPRGHGRPGWPEPGQGEGRPRPRTLELVAQGIRDSMLTQREACRVIDVLCDHEAYLPRDGATFTRGRVERLPGSRVAIVAARSHRLCVHGWDGRHRRRSEHPVQEGAGGDAR